MKKWSYLLSGVLIGVLVATSGNAFAAQVKSLVGEKVTGEYKVIVNGKELQDKGAVISGRTTAPVRGIAQAIGADLKVEGKVITITTEEPTSDSQSVQSNGKYDGWSKRDIEDALIILKERVLTPTEKGREEILSDIQILEQHGPSESLTQKKQQLAEYDEMIVNTKKDISEAEAALSAIK